MFTSFEFPSRDAIDSCWAEEVEPRIDAHDEGRINSVTAGTALLAIMARKKNPEIPAGDGSVSPIYIA